MQRCSFFSSSFFNVMHYSRLLCTENMEVSQYVKTESFESFFVREMTHRGLKCVTSVPVCHLMDKK